MTTSTPGPRFRLARERILLSQAKAARLAGVPPSYLSDFELGRRSGVRLETLYAWCVACGIDPAEIDKRLASVKV